MPYRPYPLFIGLRYTGSPRRNQLVSFISRVAMLGMVIGVGLLILVLSVMNGFDREMRSRILGLVPHITVTRYQPNASWPLAEQTIVMPGVVASAGYLQANAMLLRGREVAPVLLYGIDPEAEAAVSILPAFLPAGAMQGLTGDSDGVLLGAPLAENLNLAAGDAINLMLSVEGRDAATTLSVKRLQVLALFDTGTEIDRNVVLVHRDTALKIVPETQLQQGLRLRLADILSAPFIARELNQRLPAGFTATDWTRTHGNLYAAIQLSKRLVGLMLLTIVAVAAFNVISALIMVVNDKRADIAILRTQGASRGGIMLVFMIQGTLIGAIGTLLGVLLGTGLSLVVTDLVAGLEQVMNFRFLQSDVYPVNYLPAELRWADVLMVSGTALAMSVLATLYPAWRAARVAPADALRYE